MYDRCPTVRVLGPAVWTYQVREKVDHVPPTPRYLRVMLQAGLEHGFPDGYLDQVRGVETA